MRLSKRRRDSESSRGDLPMTARERSLAMVASMIHADYRSAEQIAPKNGYDGYHQAIDLSMIAAALLINWSKEVGIDPKDLLADIALGQALEATTR
jgi:hypothetical protein